MSKQSHEMIIRKALDLLRTQPSGSFVIFENPDSGKFVQFSGSADEPLVLDLPTQGLSEAELMMATEFFASFGVSDPTDHGDVESFILDFGTDCDQATEAAVKILQQVHWLTNNDPLTVTMGQ